MTISCKCPKCNRLCAFSDKSAGRKARCWTCGQIFIIPAEDGAKPEEVKIEVQKPSPEPGFYRAVFLESWKIFVNPASVTSLVFVIAVVSFKFFLLGACCLGPVAYFVVWGWLLGFYLNVIYEAAYGVEELPEIYLGTFLSFWWYVLKPFLIFVVTLTLVLIPFFVAREILSPAGARYTMRDIWVPEFGRVTILQMLFVAGLFVFPIAILTVAVSRDWSNLRPDCLIEPIVKGIRPYSTAVAILVAACFLELQTQQYSQLETSQLTVIGAHLLFNISVQVVAIIAMRAIGLFCRHYSCYLAW